MSIMMLKNKTAAALALASAAGLLAGAQPSARACTRKLGELTRAKGTKQTPLRKAPLLSAAIWIANRVLPTPPMPTMVRAMVPWSTVPISLLSSPRLW